MKLVKIACSLIAISGLSQAATVTLSSGLSSQGVTVSRDLTALPTFHVSIGSWDGLVFTTFGASFTDDGKINGAQTSQDTFFNGKQVAVFLGTGADIASSGTEWVVFTRQTALNFPANVVPAGNTTFAISSSSVVNVLAKGDIAHSFSTPNNFNFVSAIPEPSTMLLGALGALGLLRRRR
jgi:hypothetical protein